MCRVEDTDDAGVVISESGYDVSLWVKAKVPGTVLTSYIEAGLYPDSFYADHQLLIPDKFMTADFWYRAEFAYPEGLEGRQRGGDRWSPGPWNDGLGGGRRLRHICPLFRVSTHVSAANRIAKRGHLPQKS